MAKRVRDYRVLLASGQWLRKPSGKVFEGSEETARFIAGFQPSVIVPIWKWDNYPNA